MKKIYFENTDDWEKWLAEHDTIKTKHKRIEQSTLLQSKGQKLDLK